MCSSIDHVIKKNLLEDEAPDPPSPSPLEITQSLDLPQYFNIYIVC